MQKEQKATIGKSVENARNLSGSKELVHAMSLIVSTSKGPREVVTARWWMGRSSQASEVHCSIWVHGHLGNGTWTSGRGTAGGYGYCKKSAAFSDAVSSANIKLATYVNGVGIPAVREALEAIAKALGFRGRAIVIEH